MRLSGVPARVILPDTFSWEAMSPENIFEKRGTAGDRLHFALGTKRFRKEDYAQARDTYRPDKVMVLFIAESPPASGGYFYFRETIGKDHLFRETMKALQLWPVSSPMKRGLDKRPFLRKFCSRGFFLIDTCELPIDKMSRRDRTTAIAQGSTEIGSRVRELDPSAIVVVKATVFRPVNDALKKFGLGDRVLNREPLPFPSHGNQKKYRERLRLSIKRLAVHNVTEKRQ